MEQSFNSEFPVGNAGKHPHTYLYLSDWNTPKLTTTWSVNSKQNPVLFIFYLIKLAFAWCVAFVLWSCVLRPLWPFLWAKMSKTVDLSLSHTLFLITNHADIDHLYKFIGYRDQPYRYDLALHIHVFLSQSSGTCLGQNSGKSTWNVLSSGHNEMHMFTNILYYGHVTY